VDTVLVATTSRPWLWYTHTVHTIAVVVVVAVGVGFLVDRPNLNLLSPSLLLEESECVLRLARPLLHNYSLFMLGSCCGTADHTGADAGRKRGVLCLLTCWLARVGSVPR
jgi:hypothetical protein